MHAIANVSLDGGSKPVSSSLKQRNTVVHPDAAKNEKIFDLSNISVELYDTVKFTLILFQYHGKLA